VSGIARDGTTKDTRTIGRNLCPGPWRRWITGRHYEALTSTRIEYRSKSEQLPSWAMEKMTQLLDEASEPLPVRHACFTSDVDRFLT